MQIVAKYLIEEYGFTQAKSIAIANIGIGDGKPGYWAGIHDEIVQAHTEFIKSSKFKLPTND